VDIKFGTDFITALCDVFKKIAGTGDFNSKNAIRDTEFA
jgi:hypothetical protein